MRTQSFIKFDIFKREENKNYFLLYNIRISFNTQYISGRCVSSEIVQGISFFLVSDRSKDYFSKCNVLRG